MTTLAGEPTTSVTGGMRGRHARAATIVAAWAAACADEYLIYERDERWYFAAGVRADIRLTPSAVTIRYGETERVHDAGEDPAAALAAALKALPLADWRVYGHIDFDFCAPYLGAAHRLSPDDDLAYLFVPEREAVLDSTRLGEDEADVSAAITAAGPWCEELVALARTARDVDAPACGVDVSADPDDYRGRVAAAVADITAGRYEKVIMSREVAVDFAVDFPATYARGRAANSPARSFLMRCGGLSMTGFSPELVGAVDGSGTVVTEPLAGTRALGRSPEQDAAARIDLVTDPKEITEHAVSVRTSMSEIESVSVPGTTIVTEFMAVRERGSVQHLASTVQGILAPQHDPWQALRVLFPSVTASGIPKREAVDAIFRLEPQRRGRFCGAVVTASSRGELEAALVLRSVVDRAGRTTIRAGAGIVGQSRPEREFAETAEKLASIAPHLVARDGGEK